MEHSSRLDGSPSCKGPMTSGWKPAVVFPDGNRLAVVRDSDRRIQRGHRHSHITQQQKFGAELLFAFILERERAN